MNALAYSSYKHQSDQELLDRLGRAILVLKLRAQDRLSAYGLDACDVHEAREHVEHFLDNLARCTRLVLLEHIDDPDDVDMAFTGLADRFIDVNPADVPDRIAELIRLRGRLDRDPEAALKERDFRLLDGIQALLEQETSEGVRGLYAF